MKPEVGTGGAPRQRHIPLDAERYLAEATERTGLRDFGAERFLNDYFQTMAALNEEARFSPSGHAAIEEFAIRMLINRLRMRRDLKAHPEIEQQELAPPIVITGFPRTGSSKLQRMLSASPQLQPLTFWKLLNVAPFPEMPRDTQDPRIAAAQTAEEIVKAAYPDIWAAHPTPALDAEEDIYLHELTFHAPTIPMRMGAPKLMRLQSPLSPYVYEELRTTLKYIQWQHADKHGSIRPFVLKSPIHISSLKCLVDTFPGCKVVHCHRAIELSIVSTASMMYHSQRIFLDAVDARIIGLEVLHYWAAEWESNLEQRKSVDPKCYYDLSFTDINANAIIAIERLFEFTGMHLSESARAAMLQWEADNTRHKHGQRRYRAEDFQLKNEQIREVCAAYVAKFESLGLLGSTETAR